jgi:hypothetical protein
MELAGCALVGERGGPSNLCDLRVGQHGDRTPPPTSGRLHAPPLPQLLFVHGRLSLNMHRKWLREILLYGPFMHKQWLRQVRARNLLGGSLDSAWLLQGDT